MEPTKFESPKKSSHGTLVVLLLILLVLVAYFGFKKVGNVQDEAASLRANLAQQSLDLGNKAPTTVVERKFANKAEEDFYKAAEKPEKITTSVTVDPTLDADIQNTANKLAPSGLLNNYTDWGVLSYTNPGASQVAKIVALAGKTYFQATNRIMVASGDWPLFIRLDAIPVLSGSKTNPSLRSVQQYGPWYSTSAFTSTNVVMTPVQYIDDQGNVVFTQNLPMIPANQTASLRIVSLMDESIMYPDTYSANINNIYYYPVYFENGVYKMTQKSYSQPIYTQNNSTNKLAVVGDTGPYITNYPTGNKTINDTLTFEGFRFGASVTVKISYYDNVGTSYTVPDFNLATVTSTGGKKAISFSIAGQGINLGNYYGGIRIQLGDQNGLLSNTKWIQLP